MSSGYPTNGIPSAYASFPPIPNPMQQLNMPVQMQDPMQQGMPQMAPQMQLQPQIGNPRFPWG